MPFIIASRFYFVAIICHKGVDGPAIDIYMGCFWKGGMVIERMGAGADFFKKALAFAIFPSLVFVISLVADRAGAETESAAATIADLELAKSEAGRTPQYPLIVRGLRLGVNGSRTRFVLDVSRPVGYRVFTLGDPYRVVVDLPEAGWQLPRKPLPSNKGVVQTIRYGLFKPGATRVVIDVKGPVSVAKAFALPASGSNSHRLVIDMRPVSQEVFRHEAKAGMKIVAASKGAPGVKVVDPMPLVSVDVQKPRKPDTIVPPVAPALALSPMNAPFPRKTGPRVVAIDPGHGGVDPGAIGAGGTYEKHITLAMARELKSRLEATGRYKVFMTRDRDVFVRLRDRVRMARNAKAELFVSLHADKMYNPNIRGLSVYTLSKTASDKEAALLAEKENKADLIAGIDLSTEAPEVTNILIDLAQRETMNQSSKLADHLVDALKREIRLLPNTHRFAGFAVLKAPDMPSVLVELGFLSNPNEERLLRKKSYRDQLGGALTRGIDKYFRRVEEARRR